MEKIESRFSDLGSIFPTYRELCRSIHPGIFPLGTVSEPKNLSDSNCLPYNLRILPTVHWLSGLNKYRPHKDVPLRISFLGEKQNNNLILLY